MCKRYSSEYGYICNDCFQELVNLGPQMNVASFMDSKKKPEIDVEAAEFVFSRIFERID